VARFIVAGSVAVDDVVGLLEPLRQDAHLRGVSRGRRLGGGGANTAIPLAQAGHEVVLATVVGSDADGDWLLQELRAAGLDTAQVVRVVGPSTRSTVLVEPGGERTIVNLHRCWAPELLRRLDGIEADAVYVRSSERDLAPWMAKRLGRGLVVAHMPPTADGSRPAHLLLGSATDLSEADRRDPRALGRRVAGLAPRMVIVTHGAEGATAYSGETAIHAAASVVQAIDSTGAGDVFAAGLLHALAGGASDARALATAVRWGSAAVVCEGLPPSERILALTSGG